MLSALTDPLSVAPVAVTLVAALVVAAGASVEVVKLSDRAVDGAASVDRLDLEVVLGIGCETGERRPSR